MTTYSEPDYPRIDAHEKALEPVRVMFMQSQTYFGADSLEEIYERLAGLGGLSDPQPHHAAPRSGQHRRPCGVQHRIASSAVGGVRRAVECARFVDRSDAVRSHRQRPGTW